MTDQHRATPEQWADQEKWASPPDSDPYALCLLELRARVEALEKAKRPVAGRFPSLRMETVYADPSVPVEGWVREVSLTPEEVDAIVAAQRFDQGSADSLVERVMDAMDEHVGVNRYAEARAAIREVAEWFEETRDSPETAAALRDEANR